MSFDREYSHSIAWFTDALARLTERGGVELDRLSEKERHEFAEFAIRYWAVVPEEHRVELLEQLAGHDLVTDKTLLVVLRLLSREERISVGLYLGKITQTEKYLHSFYECFPDFDYDTRQKFYREFSHTPKDIILIAPFVDISKIEKDDKRLLDMGYDLVEDSDRLIDAMITYREKHPFVAPPTPVFTSVWQRNDYQRTHQTDPILSVLQKYFGDSGKGFLRLAPFLSRAKNIGLDLTVPEGYFDRLLIGADGQFLVGEEQVRLKRLVEKIKKISPDFVESNWMHVEDLKMYSPSIREESSALSAAQKFRIMTRYIDGYSQLSVDLEPKEFALKLADHAFPATEAVFRLNFSGEDCLQFLKQCRAEGYGFFVERTPDEFLRFFQEGKKRFPEQRDAIETEVIEGIEHDIRLYRGESYSTQTFARFMHRVEPFISPQLFSRLIEAINTHAPELWMYNPLYGIQYGSLHTEEKLRALMNENPQIFLAEFSRAHDAFQKQEYADALATLKKIVKKYIEDHCEVLLAKNVDPFIFGLITPEEKQRLFLQALDRRVPEVRLLIGILEDTSLSHLHEKCREKLSQPSFFRNMLRRNSHLSEEIFAQIPEKKLFELFLSDSEYPLSGHQITGWFFRYLCKHPEQISLVQRWLARSSQVVFVTALYFSFQNANKENEKKIIGQEYQRAFMKMCKDSLFEWCKRDPDLVFSRGIIGILGPDAYPLIRSQLETRLLRDPSELFSSSYFPREMPVEIQAFGISEFQALFDRHSRLFLGDADVMLRWVQSAHQWVRIPDIHPLSNIINQRSVDESTFQQLEAQLTDSPFFLHYQPKWKKVREDEKSWKLENELSKNFLGVYLECYTLDQSPLARDNASWILQSLSESEREQILFLLVTLEEHGLSEPVFDFAVFGFADVEKNLRQRLEPVVARQFDVHSAHSLDAIPTSSLYALFTYQKVSCDEKPMQSAFREYVNHSGSHFQTWKLWGSDTATEEDQDVLLSRMKRQKLLPRGLSLSQYRSWTQSAETRSREELKFEGTHLASAIHDMCAQAVADGHLPEVVYKKDIAMVRDERTALLRPLEAWSKRSRELSNLFAKARADKKAGRPFVAPTKEEEQEHKQLQASIREFREKNETAMNELTALLYLHRLQRITMSELETQQLEVDKSNVPFKNVFDLLKNTLGATHPDFVFDLTRIESFLQETYQTTFGGKRVSRQELVFSDAVDQVDYFHIGEFPVPSCQHWEGSKHNNRGLLSYSIDPNVKFILMRDVSGKLLGRAALRLLEREDESPALFIERVYSTNTHPKIKELFLRFASKKAASMGVPLYSHRFEIELENVVSDPSTVLESRGSRSGYVYTDAGGGLIPKGEYVIDNLVQIP